MSLFGFIIVEVKKVYPIAAKLWLDKMMPVIIPFLVGKNSQAFFKEVCKLFHILLLKPLHRKSSH